MKNPLALAFAMVLKEKRLKYELEKGLSEDESISIIADSCAIAENSIKGIESGHYVPSIGVVSRLVDSGIYEINYPNAMIYIGTLEKMGKEFLLLDKYIEKCESAKKLIFGDDLYEIIEASILLKLKDGSKNSEVKKEICKSGILEKVHSYLSHDEYLPKKITRYFSEFASREDMKLIYDMQVIKNWITLEGYQDIWDKNNKCYTIIYKDKSKNELLGHYKLLPLTKNRIADYFGLNVRRGTKEDFASSYKEAHGLYIGIVSYSNKYNCGIILKEMLEQIRDIISLSNIRVIFTVAETAEGRHLCERFEFQQIANSKIRFLNLNESKLEELGISSKLNYN